MPWHATHTPKQVGCRLRPRRRSLLWPVPSHARQASSHTLMGVWRMVVKRVLMYDNNTHCAFGFHGVAGGLLLCQVLGEGCVLDVLSCTSQKGTCPSGGRLAAGWKSDKPSPSSGTLVSELFRARFNAARLAAHNVLLHAPFQEISNTPPSKRMRCHGSWSCSAWHGIMPMGMSNTHACVLHWQGWNAMVTR